MTKMSPVFSAIELLGQAAAPGPQQPGDIRSMISSALPLLLMLGAFYFLLIAPQRKKQKEHEKMLKALQSGDEVVTSGGLYGTITNVKEDRFVVRIADNTKVEIAKGFVQTVVKQQQAAEKK
ncbi:MAG TPA: preprotein translocase subunit YajC [Opitutaceae bacterium]|nr:preprotein translocase subunit YajC [Opitutaceae bacterium]